MDTPEFIEIKLLSTPEVIQEFEAEWNAFPDQVKIVSSGPEKDPTYLEFGLMEVAAIVAIVQGALYFGEISAKLYRWLKDNKNKNKRIVIQTPLGSTEFVATNDLTEAEVREHLKRLASV